MTQQGENEENMSMRNYKKTEENISLHILSSPLVWEDILVILLERLRVGLHRSVCLWKIFAKLPSHLGLEMGVKVIGISPSVNIGDMICSK